MFPDDPFEHLLYLCIRLGLVRIGQVQSGPGLHRYHHYDGVDQGSDDDRCDTGCTYTANEKCDQGGILNFSVIGGLSQDGGEKKPIKLGR